MAGKIWLMLDVDYGQDGRCIRMKGSLLRWQKALVDDAVMT